MTPGDILDILHSVGGITDIRYSWKHRYSDEPLCGTHLFGFARRLKGETRTGHFAVTEEFLARVGAVVGREAVRRQIERSLAEPREEIVIEP